MITAVLIDDCLASRNCGSNNLNCTNVEVTVTKYKKYNVNYVMPLLDSFFHD